MAGSIICGVDDSESAKQAARVARGLSSMLDLGLVFVRVVEPGSNAETMTAVAERLERLTDAATDVDCGAAWLIDVGHPADGLVSAATDEEASMIVVGSHGPRSSLLGSVSAEVSRRAPCPVVVVPPGAGMALSRGVAPFAVDPSRRMGDSNVAGGIVRFNLGSRGQLD
jgi:nucleotide-binding universal stress UspA family protein